MGDIYLFDGLAIHLYSWTGAEDPATAANVLRHRVLNTTPPLLAWLTPIFLLKINEDVDIIFNKLDIIFEN